ncbi:DUF58 domain-containing protein [bacterium]|nr:DUF58 domain-containing protein [bacterium]
MIVPRNCLIMVIAFIGISVSLWFALYPGVSPGIVAIIGLMFLGIVALDAALGLNLIPDGLRFSVPDSIRLVVQRSGIICLRLDKPDNLVGKVDMGLVLPRWIETKSPEKHIILPVDAESVEIQWDCIGLRRGLYHLERVVCQRSSPLGLWNIRWSNTLESEIRVYPDVSRDRRSLAGLFLKRNLTGLHVHRMIGKGREFQQLREYIPGDSYEDIHWKVSAKRRSPITKIFQIEQTQQIYLVIDTSRLSATMVDIPQKEPEPQLESYISAALVTALAAERMGDKFGMITFDDQVRHFIKAGSGHAHYSACRDILNTVQTRRVNPDFKELYTFLRLRLNRRALIIVLTHLDDPVLAENFNKYIVLLSRQHVLLVNMIRPAGIGPLFEDMNVQEESDVYGQLGGQMLWHNLQVLSRTLKRSGIGVRHVAHTQLCSEIVAQYLSVRRRQIL